MSKIKYIEAFMLNDNLQKAKPAGDVKKSYIAFRSRNLSRLREVMKAIDDMKTDWRIDDEEAGISWETKTKERNKKIQEAQLKEGKEKELFLKEVQEEFSDLYEEEARQGKLIEEFLDSEVENLELVKMKYKDMPGLWKDTSFTEFIFEFLCDGDE